MSDEAPPSTATILQNVQQLNDIEGDLADTAVAVALAPPTTVPEAGAEQANIADPVIQNAEAMEMVLEQSIPDAPVDPITSVDPDVSVAEKEEQMPTQAQVAVDNAIAGADTVSQPPIATSSPSAPVPFPSATSASIVDPLPSSAPISAPEPESTVAVNNNSDEIVIDDEVSEPTVSEPTANGNGDTTAIETDQTSSETIPPAVDALMPNTVDAPVEPITNGHISPLPTPAATQEPEVVPPTSITAVSQPVDASFVENNETSPVDLPFPDGITATSPSVTSNPDIIRDWQRYPSNPEVILALFDWSIQRSEIIDARAWHNLLSKENPTASQPLLDLINLESSLTNFSAVENLFARALKGPSGGITASPDVNIWKAYLHYIRRQNPIGTGAADEDAKRRVITDAYEFALKQCGVDRDAGEIWGEYIAFVQEAKAKNTWETQAQQDTLRKIYQRAICIPLNNVEVLWKGYDAFEGIVNKQTSKKFLAERSPAYMTARTALRELRNLTDTLPHPVIPLSPSFSDSDRQIVAGWKAYLKWEEGNPLVISEPEVLADRVGYAMRRSVAEMRHFPEMWHYVAHHYSTVGKTDEAAEVLKAGVEACPKSILLTFATAELEEERKNLSEAHGLFTNLTEILSKDVDELIEVIAKEVNIAKGPEIPRPQAEGMDIDGEGPEATYNRLSDEREERGKLVQERRGKEVIELSTAIGVVWIMYMRFTRRAEGLKAARAIFGKARKSAHVTWHVFEAAALMEYHVNKDSAVAIRIFELGFKLFSEDVDYVVRYLQFLLNVNDDTNARALFERSTLKIPSDKARPLWDAWARYEYMYGDLGAVQKLEARFTENFPADSPLKRFAQRYTYNGIDQIARRDLGFGLPPRSQPAPAVTTQPQFIPPLPSQAQSQPLLPPQNAIHPLPPMPMQNASPMAKRPHPQSPLRGTRRSNSPSRQDFSGGGKRYRPNSPPPPPRRFDALPAAPVLPPPREGGRGYGPPPRVSRDRSPLPIPVAASYGAAPGYGPGAANGRIPSGSGLPPIPVGMSGPFVSTPRDGWDRSGVSRGLAWFVGQLPNARSFDGPVFRPDDIMGLFSNIGSDGLRMPVGGPAPGYGGAPIGNGGGYAEPARGYGGGPPPRRY